MREILSFSISNSLNAIVPVSLLGNNTDQMDTANATTQYSWSLSGFTFAGENLATIQYKPVGAASFLTATVSFTSQTIQSVLNALNTLNLGYFVYDGTQVLNYNQNIVFGTLNIYSSSAPSLTYTFQSLFAGGTMNIDVNASNVFTGTTPQTPATSGNLPVANGDSVTFYGVSTNTGTLVRVRRIDNSTSVITTLYTNALPSLTPFTYTFIVASGYTYVCSFADP